MIAFHVRDLSEWLAIAPSAVGSVSHVLTDPPYPEHVQGEHKLFSNTLGGKAQEHPAPFAPLDSLAFVAPLALLARRWSLFHCSLESLGDYRNAHLASWVRSCIYLKTKAMPQLTADRPGSKAEGMALFHALGEKKRWNNGGRHNVFVASPDNRKDTGHPTGKPLMLCMAIVEAFTDPGESILDPFCGTGAYGLACAALGRDYLGTDINPEYVAYAAKRASAFRVDEALRRYEEHKAKGWNA